jgi:hypothetical protein
MSPIHHWEFGVEPPALVASLEEDRLGAVGRGVAVDVHAAAYFNDLGADHCIAAVPSERCG